MKRSIKSLLAALVVSLSLVAPVLAGEAERRQRCAVRGYAFCQWDMGYHYDRGKGVPQDYAKAVEWYRKAAEQGYFMAQSALGSMYGAGNGVPRDYAKAMEWWRKAAEQNHDFSMVSLSQMYNFGLGVPQDYVLAHKWINLAAAIRSPGEALTRAIEIRDSLAKKMTPAQIAEAQRLAREWKPKK